MNSLDQLLRTRQLLVCIGPGGVGKTTVSATLALRAAALGKRVLVLTIDPARRLADALGLSLGEDRFHPVDLSSIKHVVPDCTGTLHASMFDQSQSMDRLMARLAPNEQAGQRVLRNRVYRAMAGSLARSHAYLAMERLHEAMTSGEFDLVILDTPPTRSALDILDAPGKLAAFLDEGVMRWFSQTKESTSWKSRVLAFGEAAATKLLGVLAGQEFLREIVDFFDAFSALREGFFARSKSVQAMLRANTTGFVLVSSADTTHLADAEALVQDLRTRELRLSAAVYNRSYEPLRDDPTQIATALNESDEARFAQALATARGQPDEDEASVHVNERYLERVHEVTRAACLANAQAIASVSTLHQAVSDGAPAYLAARLEKDIRDLPGLVEFWPFFARSHSLS